MTPSAMPILPYIVICDALLVRTAWRHKSVCTGFVPHSSGLKTCFKVMFGFLGFDGAARTVILTIFLTWIFSNHSP